MSQIREINVDNVVEFLNTQKYSLEYMMGMSFTYSKRFNLTDYQKFIDELVRYFFSGVTYVDLPRRMDFLGSPMIHKEEIVNKIFKNVNELSFIHMYPNIIINLYNKGEVEFNVVELPDIYTFVVKNKNEIQNHPNIKEESKKLTNLIINYLFGSSFNQKTKIYITEIDKVIEYYRGVYEKIFDINGFLYANLDELYFEDSVKEQVLDYVNKLDIPYEIKECSNFCYFDRRRFVRVVDGDIKVMGYDYPGKPNFRKRKDTEQYKYVKKVVNKFEIELRQDKIKKLKQKIYN